jgi:D-beta-D-heptose 7-phosphate kinase/D-beta-D-heptose 1-phosphate adenosyltransferase
MLLRHLDAKVTLAGVLGSDSAGRTLSKLLDDEQIDHELVLVDEQRPTTEKERFVGRASNQHPHQILRVDRETRAPIDDETAARLTKGILRRIPGQSAIVISDYAKGVCTPRLLNAIINAARHYRIPVVVDPARINDYSRYRRASLITPNRGEAELATDSLVETPADAFAAGRHLVTAYLLGAAFITMDRDGIAVIRKEGEGSDQHMEPARAREVYDITGAGDMVVAICGLCLGAGLSLEQTARLANLAAGLEIEQFGIAPVDWRQIANAIGDDDFMRAEASAPEPPSSDSPDKIISLPQAINSIAQHYVAGQRIVFTNGCFDLLHIGHVTFLQEAAELGDVLIVAINSDRGVRELKGPHRPVIDQQTRASMLAALTCVDYVLIFDEPTPHRMLDLLRPDVLVKGGTTEEVVGREVVEAYGGEVYVLPATSDVSTTRILSEIQDSIGMTDKGPAVGT